MRLTDLNTVNIKRENFTSLSTDPADVAINALTTSALTTNVALETERVYENHYVKLDASTTIIELPFDNDALWGLYERGVYISHDNGKSWSLAKTYLKTELKKMRLYKAVIGGVTYTIICPILRLHVENEADLDSDNIRLQNYVTTKSRGHAMCDTKDADAIIESKATTKYLKSLYNVVAGATLEVVATKAAETFVQTDKIVIQPACDESNYPDTYKSIVEEVYANDEASPGPYSCLSPNPLNILNDCYAYSSKLHDNVFIGYYKVRDKIVSRGIIYVNHDAKHYHVPRVYSTQNEESFKRSLTQVVKKYLDKTYGSTWVEWAECDSLPLTDDSHYHIVSRTGYFPYMDNVRNAMPRIQIDNAMEQQKNYVNILSLKKAGELLEREPNKALCWIQGSTENRSTDNLGCSIPLSDIRYESAVMLDNTTIVLERYGDAGWHITLGRKNVMTTDVFVLSNRHRPFMPTEKWAYVMRHALSNIFPFIYVPSYAFGWDDNHKRAMIKIPNPDDVKISNDIIRRVSVIGHTRDISMSEFVKRIQDVIKQRPEVKQTTEEPAEPIPF